MRTEGFKGALLSVLVIASLITPLLLSSPSPVRAALTPHDPIYIYGNDNFTPANGVNGGGSGAENDPYIIENYIIDASTVNGIEIRNTTAYFVVRNCVVENGGGTYYGIYLVNVVNGRIENNTCDNNEDGIYLEDSDNNTLTGNTCQGNYYHGIWLEYSDNNIFDNNTCKNNGWGIYLWDSGNNTLTNNTCENNFRGIRLWNSSNNTFSNNIVSNNFDYGIQFRYSNNNLIYHNNFVNNATQAYDYPGTNNWDNGYPWGGNYWSDYTGADIYGGEDQNLSGSDRIGDTPYYIPGDNNIDRYPLMNPFPLSWTGLARVFLPTIKYRPLVWPPPCHYRYAVILETNVALYQGSKLVVKFYAWGGYFQAENVVWSGATPDNVSFLKIVLHPGRRWPENVRLDLTTDNTENVISTITSFIVCKVDLEKMFTEIPLWWALDLPEDRICLEIMFSEIPLRWALAPSCK